MSLTASAEVISATTSSQLQHLRGFVEGSRNEQEFEVDTSRLDADGLLNLATAARSFGDTKTARAAESIALALSGKFTQPLPNFKAFQAALIAFLKHNILDGWIYVEGRDKKLYPQLVVDVVYDTGMRYGRSGQPSPSVIIQTTSYGPHHDGNNQIAHGVADHSHHFIPKMVANRRVADILASVGIYKETSELRTAYLASMKRHQATTKHAFSDQFRVSGGIQMFEENDWQRRGITVTNRRVIHDMNTGDYGAMADSAESAILEGIADRDGFGAVPQQPVVRVFDLVQHEFMWVHADNMTPFEYDGSLRAKLVLPPTHRDLLDVLTSDLSAFVEDFVEGKSAGNVILCKGVPGVGKTLTAEVYAELIQRPLYSIHSGSLGTTADDIEENLELIFDRAVRWNCVLLLDEADVFVVERGDNIEQNAIVAVFLRKLEYFNGLLFMTTNRPDSIDEAIISRSAAIIEYTLPPADDAAAIWRVMAAQYKADLGNDLIQELVKHFPKISPRDIKMLLRLALRVSAKDERALTLDTFRRCAMFRAIQFQA